MIFLTKNPNVKIKCGGGGEGEVYGWTAEQAQTDLSLQLLRSWGHNNALMCKLCP